MLICKVIGTIVSTEKIKEHSGRAIMIVQPLDEKGKDAGASFLAIDCIGCGTGETVLVNKEGGSARIAYGDTGAGVHSVISAKIDTIHSAVEK